MAIRPVKPADQRDISLDVLRTETLIKTHGFVSDDVLWQGELKSVLK